MKSPKPKRTRAKQKRVQEIVYRLAEYVNSYHHQSGYLDYSDVTLMNDFLYGIGVAFDPDEYGNALGFDKFKRRLREHLGT